MPQSTKAIKKPDYLAELRNQRLERENFLNNSENGSPNRRHLTEKTIENLLHDRKLNEYEKIDAVKREAEKLEINAR